MPAHSSIVNPSIVFSIHGPATTITTTTARIFGMKVSVGSCSCVTAWKIETSRPTTRLTPSTGIEICSVSHIVRAPISMIWLWSISAVPLVMEAPDERLGHQVPAVHQHEQQDLERQ